MDKRAQAERVDRALGALAQAQRALQKALDRVQTTIEHLDAARRRRARAAAGTRQLGGTWRWN
jgi:hypothetical protein